jgi:hypothetical protein
MPEDIFFNDVTPSKAADAVKELKPMSENALSTPTESHPQLPGRLPSLMAGRRILDVLKINVFQTLCKMNAGWHWC